MKRTLIKCGVIAAVFLASLLILSKLMNQGNTDMTMEMSEASYPIVSMKVDGYEVNRLHGYAQAMDTAYLREQLLPVGSDRQVSVLINTYQTEFSQIAFEVRSLDGERLVESTEVSEYEEDGEQIYFDITLKDLIDPDTEYMLVVLLTPAGGETIRYYTRLLQSEELYVKEKLDYITDFSERTFDKEEAAELTKYLESNAEGDNTSFHQVNIHSSFDQVTWGALEPERIGEPIITISELASQTGSFVLDYYVTTKEGKETAYYRVSEFYRVRYTADRMYLLDYEREMEQIFDEKAKIFTNNKIALGIGDETVVFKESDGGNVFAFVASDKLYSYNVTDNKLARLFSFYGNLEYLGDERAAYDRHDVQILTVDETGNVAFAVYGYMNRGRHEGEVGIAIYYYNSLMNTVEELAYLPYDKSCGLLKANVSTLSHMNPSGVYYVLLDDGVYAVDLNTRESRLLVSGLQKGTYHVSQSQEMLVWQEGGKAYSAQSLTLLNLNTQTQTIVEAGTGEYISVLGFMEEDLIYGLAKQQDVMESETGSIIFPMYHVKIQNDQGQTLKSYQKDGIYVTDSLIEQNQITLKRVVWNEEQQCYDETDDDQIMSSEMVRVGTNVLSPAVTERYETVRQIAVKEEIDADALKHLTPKEVLFEGSRTTVLNMPQSEGQHYYVYAKNDLAEIFTQEGAAVRMAYEQAGVVMDDEARCIWKRETRSTRNQIMAITEDEASEERSSLAVCLDTILRYEGISQNTQRMLDRGETVLGILTRNLQGRAVLDLSGCSLDCVLYYVNKDLPVLATLEDGNAVLIVGFNELNIVVMDPQTGTLYKKGMNDSMQWFAGNGNQFVTYVTTEE